MLETDEQHHPGSECPATTCAARQWWLAGVTARSLAVRAHRPTAGSQAAQVIGVKAVPASFAQPVRFLDGLVLHIKLAGNPVRTAVLWSPRARAAPAGTMRIKAPARAGVSSSLRRGEFQGAAVLVVADGANLHGAGDWRGDTAGSALRPPGARRRSLELVQIKGFGRVVVSPGVQTHHPVARCRALSGSGTGVRKVPSDRYLLQLAGRPGRAEDQVRMTASGARGHWLSCLAIARPLPPPYSTPRRTRRCKAWSA